MGMQYSCGYGVLTWVCSTYVGLVLMGIVLMWVRNTHVGVEVSTYASIEYPCGYGVRNVGEEYSHVYDIPTWVWR